MDTPISHLSRGVLCLIVTISILSCAGYEELDRPSSRPVVNQKELQDGAEIRETSSWQSLEDYPDPSGSLRLPDVLLLALKYNPKLKSFSEKVRARDAAALQASLPPNPRLELGSEEFGGSGNRSGFDNAEFSGKLSQLILLGGELENRTDVAEARRDLSAVDYQVQRIRVFTNVAQSFFSVLTQQKRLDLAKRTLELARQLNSSVTSRVEAGDERPVEQTRSEVGLENERIRLERIRRKLDNAKSRLASFWGNTEITFDKVVGAFGKIIDLPKKEKLVREVKQNPKFTRWDALVKERKEKLELEKAKAIPNPRFQTGVQRKEFTDQTFGILAVEFPLQLFDRNQGGIRVAKHKLKQVRWKRTSARKEVLSSFLQSYRKLNQLSQEAKRIKQKVVPKSKNVFQKIQTGYEEGEFSLLDVLDARRTFFQARSRYIQVLADYYSTRVKVESFVGKQLESIQ